MNLRESQKFPDAVLVGHVLLTESVFSHLEAFSENALCYSRGLSTMNKYKTVKEVCALTGLTRKHLYYFHHEKVVQAAAYANYSVKDYDGYKLYDDLAVEKLQQIALYYQLGMKRGEIRDMMLAPDYDSNRILETMIASEQAKIVHIERNIAALEYLILVGTKNGVNSSLRGMSLDDLGRNLLARREESAGPHTSNRINQAHMEAFTRELNSLLSELIRLEPSELAGPAGVEVIRKIYGLSRQYLGVDGVPFMLGLFMSALGEGSIARRIRHDLPHSHARAVIQYIIDHPEIYEQSSQQSPTGSAGTRRT